jgi:hypothetical protein
LALIQSQKSQEASLEIKDRTVKDIMSGGFHMTYPQRLHRMLVVLGLLLVLGACGTTTPQEAIIGKWNLTSLAQDGQSKPVNGTQASATYEFFGDGTFTMSLQGSESSAQQVKGTYTILENGQLTMTAQGDTIKGDAKINADQLVLGYDDTRVSATLPQINSDGSTTPGSTMQTKIIHIEMTFEQVD